MQEDPAGGADGGALNAGLSVSRHVGADVGRLGGFDYLFSDAEADQRLALGPAFDDLAAAMPSALLRMPLPRRAALGADEASGDGSTSPQEDVRQALLWACSAMARSLMQIRATPNAEDGHPVLWVSGSDLVPLDRDHAGGQLVNGVSTPVHRIEADRALPLAMAADAALAILCQSDVLARVNDTGASLFRAYAARSRPLAGMTPLPMELGFALFPLLIGSEGPAALLRLGYRLSLPTAQGCIVAMAQMDRSEIPILPATVLSSGPAGGATRRWGFERRTPLALYLLREAQEAGDLPRLGPLGSRLLAETLVGLGLSSASEEAVLSDGSAVDRLLDAWRAADRPSPAPMKLTP